MFILPIGMIEAHSPHRPVGADTFGVSFEANGVWTQSRLGGLAGRDDAADSLR
jgi:creatinine amidohydrolase/Fe(II)-dependent formamide hydrolase-like protein